jgi:hypothetical protein
MSGGSTDTSQGGLLPGMQSLVNYTGAEGMLQNAQNFATTPMSTNLTMADAGTRMNEALQSQKYSQALANAQQTYQNLQNANFGNFLGSVGGKLGGIIPGL